MSFSARLIRTSQDLLAATQRHRLGVVAAAAVLLAGVGATAVAVAPLVLPPVAPVQRLFVEEVQPTGLERQMGDLALHTLVLHRSDITRGNDTVDSLLGRLGVRDAQAAAFIRNDPTARSLLSGRGGKLVQAEFNEDGLLQRLSARYPSDRAELALTHFQRLVISRQDGQWQAHAEAAAYERRQRLASGTVRSSLYAATDEAGLPDAIASQLADVFAADIDFHRQLRAGDTFSVVYEALLADGDPVPWNEGAGRIIAAEFVNAGKAHNAVWFTAPDGRTGYFSADGRSKRRSFLASPMAFSRVTSGFSMRFHPLLQTWRQHKGVDYGAPTGTPVRSVGDGTVEFAGWRSGYGNVVELNHGSGRQTLYAHLSKVDVKRGQRVEQAQRIGLVGATGWATGPHLHFEFRIGGAHQDPLKIARASEPVVLSAQAQAQLTQIVERTRPALAVAETLSSKPARFE